MPAPRDSSGSNLDILRARTPFRDDDVELASTLRSVVKQGLSVKRAEGDSSSVDLKETKEAGNSVDLANRAISSLCFMALAVSFGSSVFSTAMVLTAKEFKVSPQYMLLGLSFYVIGIACGTLMFGQIPERIGSRSSIAASMVVSVVCHIIVGFASDLGTVLPGRYLAGFFGSAPIAIAPRVIFDICDTTERAIAIVALTMSLSLGPILGVIGGEFTLLAPASNWRWTIWAAVTASILSICFSLVFMPGRSRSLVRTTNSVRHQPNRLYKDGHRLGKVTGNHPAFETSLPGSRKAFRFSEQITVAMCAILVYGLVHMLLLVYPMSFEMDRAFPFGVSSLPFLAVIAGLVVGGAHLIREATKLRSRRREGAWVTCPENNLSLMVFGSYTLTIGLFVFAWTSHRDTSPWPQICSGVLTGYGIISVLAPALVCLVDASSANMSTLSVYAFLQGATASVSPLLVIPMYQKLGVRLASNLLATVCLAAALQLSFLYRQSKK